MRVGPVLLAPALATLAACAGESAPDGPEPPIAPSQRTVVLLILDALRPDHLAPYGYGRDPMPNLSALAAESAVFLDCVTTSTGTNAGIASVLTGEPASRHGVGSLKERGHQRLSDGAETLAERFRALGFTTFAAVSLPQLRGDLAGFGQGFETYLSPALEEGARDARQTFFDARPTLDALLARDTPLFLMLHFADARGTAAAPAPAGVRFLAAHLAPFAAERPELAEALGQLSRDPTGAVREINRQLGRARGSEAYLALRAGLYDGRLAHLDEHLGLFFELLRERGRWDDALIFALATRGALLTPPRGSGGPAFLPGLVTTPLLARFPHGRPRGTVEALVQPHDVFATLAELYGFSSSGTGRSLGSALDAPSGAAHGRVALCEDPRLESRAAYGTRLFLEENALVGTSLFTRDGVPVLRGEDFPERERSDELEAALAAARDTPRWSVRTTAAVVSATGAPAQGDRGLLVEWRLYDGYVRAARLEGDPVGARRDDGLRSGSLSGAATLADGQTLVLDTSRRDLPGRLALRWVRPGLEVGGTLDEERVLVGGLPLAAILLPRIAAGGDAWPIEEGQEPAPEVDIERRGGSWWKLSVGEQGAPGREVSVLYALCPPPLGHQKVEWRSGPEVRGELVAGRTDAVLLRGRTPLEVHLKSMPRMELALAVALEGAVVPVSGMRFDGRRFDKDGRVSLYLPDWLPGVTDGTGSIPPITEPAPGTVLIDRVPACEHSAATPEQLEFLRRLPRDE